MKIYIHHYRKPDICRVLKALPRVIYRALGKVTICRVPTERHSATKRHSAKICFAECLFTDTRHTCLCRVPRGQHSAHSLTCTLRTLAAPVACHGRYCLPSATQLALGKHYHVTQPLNVTVIICWVSGCGTRQRFINAECNYNGTRRSLNLCRVPSIWHSAKFSTRPVRPSRSPVHLSVRPVSTFLPSAAWHTAKVCRVPEKRHSAKPASPVEEMPCALRRVLHSANNLPSVFRPVTLGKVRESGSACVSFHSCLGAIQ